MDIIAVIAIIAGIAVASPIIVVAAYAACVFLGALFFRTERYVDNWISAILCEIDYLAQRIRR